jgi:hypothetical protein
MILAINTASLNYRTTTLDSASALLRLRETRQQAVDALSGVKADIDASGNAQKRSDVLADAGSERRSRGFLRQQSEGQDRALAQLLPVRASLSPSDEVALFAEEESSTSVTATVQSSVRAGEAFAADGEAVAVEIITQQPEVYSAVFDETIQPLIVRIQSIASQLYARNNDVVFNSAPATLLAA